MVWEVPTEEIPENLDGFDFPDAGQYHVQVNTLDEDAVSQGGSPQMAVEYEILSGNPAGQEGKTQRDYFAKSAKAIKRALMFAVAAGLITKDEITAAREAKKNLAIDYTAAVGRQLCIEIIKEEYEGKTRNKVQFGIWHLDDPAAKDIPKNAAMLAQLGDAAPDPMTNDDSPFE